ncbi:MAG TPA: gliding motility-associated ABC transporter substrate-binding protein GldG [Prolixibacteraceae bacterium]|nr:gliding motility-associated ABC transporter substrate-binding protein GldG [Prolixibacteraceae bacterium]
MFSLLKKEITSFFGSLTGYLVVFVFLLATSLFLWVFPGNYNIPESGYASLDGLFSLAPWVYLFLVPAITMRLFAEEKRLGTMEILLTRPVSALQIVWAKYLAGLLLVSISLVPTLVYFYTVYTLGNPVGCMDTGGTWGAYLGLFFLAAIYVAIGLLASALTDNPVFAFILALLVSFAIYLGFDLVGSMQFSSGVQQTITSLGINEHYNSISRGVVDSRDLVYFVAVAFVFLWITSRIIHFHKVNLQKELKRGGIAAVALILISIISGQLFFRIDLTAEKRYSIDEISINLVKNLKQPVNITLYLDGELPAGFRKLKKSIQEKVADYNAYSSKLINLIVVDPYEINDVKRRNQLFTELAEKGLQPTDIHQNTEKGTITRRIFPGAIVEYGNRQIAINLLKNNQLASAEVNWNNSIENLEYEFSSAFAELMNEDKQSVAFLTGQGELNENEVHDFASSLAEKYNVFGITTQELASNGQRIKTLIIANPSQKFAEADKFQVDQYLMNGGRVLWFVDPVAVSLDSLSNGYMTVAFPQNLNLDDQLFRYGVRLNSNLVQDAQCLLIPVNTAPKGAPAKFTPAPWYYSPLLYPSPNHVISKNIGMVKSEFVSTIDTVGKSEKVHKTVLLTSSGHSLVTVAPVEISLSNINKAVDSRIFSQPAQTVGVLLEGTFTSVYKNRMIDPAWGSSASAKTESKPTKMIVFADGNLAANQFRLANGSPEYMPLGYDRFSKQTFANKELLINAVSYLNDDSGLMELRTKAFKIRLLDKVKLKEAKLLWQMINVLLPLVLISIFGFIYIYLRRKKYTRNI